MDRLTSCYFCGAALDASLSEYPIVPETLQPGPDQQRTVVLCPTCRRKLGKVVETVLDSIEGRSDQTVLSRASGTATGQSDRAADPGGSHDEASGDASETAPDGESVGWVSAGEATETGDGGDETADASASNSGGDDGTRRDERTGGPGGQSPDEQPADQSAEETRETAGDGTESTDAGDDSDAGAADAGDRAGSVSPSGSADAANDAADASTEPTGADASTEPTGADRSSETTADDGTSDDGQSLTRLEYNKVMRLLQNREFPIDKAEIRTVATNAYQISDREFDTIIDAAVQRGLIDERDGQIVDDDE